MVPSPIRAWIRATTLGWALGIPVIALLAVLGEQLGIGGAQFLVGLGMGVSVGFTQSRVLPPGLDRRWRWILPTAAGLMAPFLAYDLATRLGQEWSYSLPRAVATGGLLVGLGQAVLYRPRVAKGGIWTGASLLGWSLAASSVWGADLLRQEHRIHGVSGLLLYFGLLLIGGLILGALTGPFLSQLSTTPAEA